MFDNLFKPLKIRDLELKNRVVMSAMGTHEAVAGLDKRGVTDKLIEFHVARAKGGCALNCVEVTAVDKYTSPAGFLSLAEDKYIDGLKKLNDAVHEAGGKTCVQLWQGGLAVASDRTCQILLPSDMPLSPQYTCPGITEERIYSIINAFGEAAKRAVEAGFDSIEFHCAHNYLPHSMLSGGINRRTDSWGGSFENRERFPLACIKAIRENMPKGMPLFMRVPCHDDMLPGGLTIEEIIKFCNDAKELGVDVINVSRGNILTAATIYEVAPGNIPNGFNVEDAARIRKETGMLTMPCGRINTPELAEEILASDKADLIVVARGQLADAEFCNKAKEGRVDEIRYCIGCNQGCYDYFVESLGNPNVEHISCTRNPAVLEEKAFELTPTKNPKKVLIVGGGIAGLEAAIDLKLTGNTPVIYEASSELGGQLATAGKLPGKADFLYAAKKAVKHAEALGIEMKTNALVDAKVIAEVKPDAVMICVGSKPATITVKGMETANIVNSFDIANGTANLVGNTALVIGGNMSGVEYAVTLAEKGMKVTVVDVCDKVLQHFGSLRKIVAQMDIAKYQINLLPSTSLNELKGNVAVIENANGVQEVQADNVVMCVGSKPLDSSSLVTACEENKVAYYVVGDAKDTKGGALTAIYDAYKAVLDVNSK